MVASIYNMDSFDLFTFGIALHSVKLSSSYIITVKLLSDLCVIKVIGYYLLVKDILF